MTRDEFMVYAEREIDAVLKTHKNRLMDVVYRAWAEGKKAAEIAALTETVKEALERMEKNAENPDRHTRDGHGEDRLHDLPDGLKAGGGDEPDRLPELPDL